MLRSLRTVASLAACLAAASLVALGPHGRPAAAQAPANPAAAPAAPPAADPISDQASGLEATLGKVKDGTPEAIDVQLKLIDLYHANGRALGLIRVANRFVNSVPSHPRHAEVMARLIDGLIVNSRNKELTATCRQFLQRYPDHAEAPRVEKALAESLEQQLDYRGAGAAYAAVWKRLKDTPDGREAGCKAIWMYANANNHEDYARAGEVAESMIDALPAGEYAYHVGAYGFRWYQNSGQWAKSNQLAKKMLDKGLPIPPADKAYLLYQMGENYSRVNQRTNAIEAYQQSRAIQDSPDLLWRVIHELYHAQAAPEQFEGLVNEFAQKHPKRPERFQSLAYLGHAYSRVMNDARAKQIFREIIDQSPRSGEAAQHFLYKNGNEPPQLAESEQVLQAALQKFPDEAGYLRYTLAIDLYRDRLKDENKARDVARALVLSSPTNDGYTQGPMHWLLGNPRDEADFDQFVKELAEARAKFFWLGEYRKYMDGWAKEARRHKETEERGKKLQAALDAADQNPILQAWKDVDSNNREKAIAARAKFLEPQLFNQIPEYHAYQLSRNQAEAIRHHGSAEERARAVAPYRVLVQRFPKNYQYATWFLEVATDYAPPEVAREAALHYLSIEPESNNSDAWRRLVNAGDKNNDAGLVKAGWEYAEKAQQKFGLEQGNATTIGDHLDKHNFKNEAMAYWRRALALKRDGGESIQCAQRIHQRLEGDARTQFLREQSPLATEYHGWYAQALVGDISKQPNLDEVERLMRESFARQQQRPFSQWGVDENTCRTWVEHFRQYKNANNEFYSEAEKRRVFKLVYDLQIPRATAPALLALLELPPTEPQTPMQRLFEYRRATTMVFDSSHDWDILAPYAQAAVARKDYVAAATLLTGMLANIQNVEQSRTNAGREMAAQSYARLGGVGLAIDESSPIAPLLQAALYLRLGDERLALETYNAHKQLFDEHRVEMPIDLILFVVESHIAAGGDENFDRAEDILRGWLVKFSEAPELEADVKASVQLLLAKNYFKAQRYDVARGEYTTVINRYAGTPQAIEAEFGVGECFMAQKVYDQAESIFTKLATSSERDVVVRAEFLRGVLANRRGDADEARDIFRKVLDMVPSVDLANQALFNLSEVYGAEQRYMDQLELLRTVGRLGRASKRWHNPGTALSIVVQDGDLGVSRGHARIPVKVVTQPGGDEETVYLYSGGAGKGLFRADLETRLGQVTKNDKVLQLTGNDVIRCDYPEEFKAEFRSVPLADAEIRIASNADFEAASAKIVDLDKETLSERLAREAREKEEADQRVSQERPANQIKPGNAIHLRVKDADRDLSDEADSVIVKLVAGSGDQVQLSLKENGPHTGVFEGQATTGELPAGALASDVSIDHSPLMAIDRDPSTFWLSEPDGATPKWLSVDMKDLKVVNRVVFSTPNPNDYAPVQLDLQGSHDGRFWFRLASVPPIEPIAPLKFEPGPMMIHVYQGNFTNLTTWKQIVELCKDRQESESSLVQTISWKRPDDAEDAKNPHAAVWSGKLVVGKAGAARIKVKGTTTALAVDGVLELAPARGERSADVWLEAGSHDLVIFAANSQGQQEIGATWAREDYRNDQVVFAPFRAADFDVARPDAEPAPPKAPATVDAADGKWTFNVPATALRHVRAFVREYRGEAVAINHVEVFGPESDAPYIPTKDDVLGLADNQVLEIAAGDDITAGYTDEFTQSGAGKTQLLTQKLQATFFNGDVTPINFDFVRDSGGGVREERKQVARVEPGERFVVEIVDYDHDVSAAPDAVSFEVRVNNGAPTKFTATETKDYSGVFTKEIDVSAKPETDKLQVKPGDRLTVVYHDEQNTFPGHPVAREAVVQVATPSVASIRVVETRVAPRPAGYVGPPQPVYLPPVPNKQISHVAFEAPLTIEVIDPDAAKDGKSTVTAVVKTTAGASIEVECVVSNALNPVPGGYDDNVTLALEEGRFVGQAILQLGGKDSPDLVPLSPSMPRGLIGGGKLPEEVKKQQGQLVARVLNLTGADVVAVGYLDARRPDGKPAAVRAGARLVANGALVCTDREYEKPVESLHVGEKMFLMVEDADRDATDERDFVDVVVTSKLGEKETIRLEESLAHSGVFQGSVPLRAVEKPTPGDWKADDPAIESFFGDLLTITYSDPAAGTETGVRDVVLEMPVVVGTDGLVAAFSKTFNDETIAVETQFHIAESYFELFKSHKKLARGDELTTDLEAGRRVLREVMEDYPSPKYAPRVAYLLGQFAQELEKWDEAIESYELIIRQYPDSQLAPDAQFKLAQCYEEAGDFDEALEAYVTLAATYPKSPLIANVMVRISEYFWKKEEFVIAAQVGEKFLERFEGHQWGPKMAFRIGQCYYKAKEFPRAGQAFDRFAKEFPDDALCADSLFWSGESYRMGTDNREAFRRYNRCRWEHPESEAAKYARGRLALPAMLQQFEAEANSVEE